jgi:hypothetical protein
MSSGDFWGVALILIGFGFLLGGATGVFVAVAIIVVGLVLSLIDRISPSAAAAPDRCAMQR